MRAILQERGGFLPAVRVHFANRRNHSALLVPCVGHDLPGEVLENLPDLEQSRFVVAVDGGNFARHEVEAGRFLLQVSVMNLLDVIAQFRRAHQLRIR
jgi:hypothetical protein